VTVKTCFAPDKTLWTAAGFIWTFEPVGVTVYALGLTGVTVRVALLVAEPPVPVHVTE
jgi:hypothetical protein